MNQQPSPFPSAETREASRRAKRDALLRAAVQMFNEQGFHQTSLDDVAARLGVSKPTIYHYLGNKDQVLLECVTMGLSQLVEAVRIARLAPGSGADRLQVFLQGYAEVIMDDFGRCVIRTDEQTLKPDSRERFRSFKRQIDGDMRALIGEGMADGSIVDGDPRLLAFTVAGALNWAARWHDPQGPMSPADLAERMVALLAGGFLADRLAGPGTGDRVLSGSWQVRQLFAAPALSMKDWHEAALALVEQRDPRRTAERKQAAGAPWP